MRKRFLFFLLVILSLKITAQSTVPPCAAPSSTFENAPLLDICCLDGYTHQLESNFLPQVPNGFCGTVENPQWLAFRSYYQGISFQLEAFNCQGTPQGFGMQMQIFELINNSCDFGALVPVSNCFASDGFNLFGTITANNLTPGHVYFILLDGWTGDICEYTLSILQTISVPPPTPEPLSGPTTVSQGQTANYALNFDGPDFDFQNPCDLFKQDTVNCFQGGDGSGNPCISNDLEVFWTGPPGSIVVTQPDLLSADVTFGIYSGEVCINYESSCGTHSDCIFVEVEVPGCNEPIAPADDCQNAPPFCGFYLDNYCSVNDTNTPDTPGNLNSVVSCPIENNQWLKFVACGETIELTIEVTNCLDFTGLEFAILRTSDCVNFEAPVSCVTIGNGVINTISASNLIDGEEYCLLIDGIGGDICQWEILSTFGISSGPVLQEENTPGYITGPSTACVGEPVTLTLVPPICQLIEIGGCPAAGQQTCEEGVQDVVVYEIERDTIWYTQPPGAEFVNGDSTGTEVTIVFPEDADPPLIGNFTVHAEIVTNIIGPLDTVQVACIAYCAEVLPDDEFCFIEPFNIEVGKVDTTYEYFVVCEFETVFFMGMIFNTPGIHTFTQEDDTGCLDVFIIEIEWIFEPFPFIYVQDITCDNVSENYIVTIAFETFGGFYYHEVNGSGVFGNTFISDPIPSGTPYYFEALSAGECYVYQETFADVHECPCLSEAGDLNQNDFVLCEDESTFVTHQGNFNLDPNDDGLFILHDGNGSPIGSALQESINGIFSFQNGMIYGQTYYIDFVVGNEIGGSIDMDDVCLSIANNQNSVVFFDIPNVLIDPVVPISTSNPITTLSGVASGGSGTFSYLWEGPNGFSANTTTTTTDTPGIYILTVTDDVSGCSAEATVNVELEFENCNINSPTAPGDNCMDAPMFCGEKLIHYCSSNQGANSSTATGTSCSIENDQWLQFMACESEVEIFINVNNCSNGTGLEAVILESEDCQSFSSFNSCELIFDNASGVATASNLMPGEVYYLMIDGINGATCDWQIDSIVGISTSPTEPINIVITNTLISPGYIEGPTVVCYDEEATYTVHPPICEWSITIDPNSLGDCPIPFDLNCLDTTLWIIEDTTYWCWIMPDTTTYLTDSCGVMTSVLFNDTLDAVVNGYWVTDTLSVDLDSVLACLNTAFCDIEYNIIYEDNCDGDIDPLEVDIIYNIEELPPIELCEGESISVCGEVYTSSTTVVCDIDCGWSFQELIFHPLIMDDLGEIVLCEGDCFEFQGIEYCEEGTYEIVQGFCASTTFSISIEPSTPTTIGVTTELCDVSNQYYTVSFDILTGVPPYSVNGVELTGSFFMSDMIMSGQPYFFDIASSTDCSPGVVLSGVFECFCETYPGTIDDSPQSICGNAFVDLGHQGDQVLDANDVLVFVLQDGSGATIEQNGTGDFSYNSSTMVYGENYTIYAIAGNDDGNGNPSTGDACYVSSTGKEVVFYEELDLEINEPDLLTCAEPVVIMESAIQGGSGNYTYLWIGANGYVETSPIANISASGNYVLTVKDAESDCEAIMNFSIEEDFTSPELTLQADDISCNAPMGSIQAEATLNILNWEWLFNGMVVSNEQNPLVAEAGTYQVIATAENGCSTIQSIEVVGNFDPPQVLGLEIEHLDCANELAMVDFDLNLPIGQASLQITDPSGNTVSTIPEDFFDEPGWYGYEILNEQNGCVLQDSLEILLIDNAPAGLDLEVNDPSCFGALDGRIIIHEVAGGTAPFKFSVGGSFLSPVNEFNGLTSGTYEIIVQDSKGCEYVESLILNEPDELMVDLGDDLEIVLGEWVNLEALINTDSASIEWTAGGDLLSDSSNVSFQPTQNVSLQIAVTDENGCEAFDAIQIFVGKKKGVFVPNIFSPNGDGNNDQVMVYGDESVATIRNFVIYNRWGEQMFTARNFQPNDNNVAWDGHLRGRALRPAVFVYVLEVEFIDGIIESYRGDIALVK